MTVTSTDTVAGVIGRELRRQVRDRLELERSRLLADERRLRESEERDPGLRRAVAITDYQIAAIDHQLARSHQPHDDDVVCADCCVLIDRGGGPEWLLLAALPETGLPVIASDSALGRALVGAKPDQDVEYPHPTGARTARVLALASGG